MTEWIWQDGYKRHLHMRQHHARTYPEKNNPYEQMTYAEFKVKMKSPHGSLPKKYHELGWPYDDPNIPYDC